MRIKQLVLAGAVFLFLGANPLAAASLSSAVGGLPSSAGYDSTMMPEGLEVSPDSAFGQTWNYLHPYFSLGEYYTDNLFNTEDNQESDFVTVITPGIWFSLPAGRQPLLDVETLNTAPGGFELTRFDTEAPRRMQAYALYRANINRHADFSEENTVNHRGEGVFRYNFRGGLSLELLDIYEVEQDPYATGNSRQLNEFTSNVLNALAVYRITPKTRLRADYSWYTLSYDETAERFRDRDDNGFSLFAFHQFWPKTSLFLEYEFVDIDYDRDLLPDSQEHHYFAGVLWDASEKLRLQGKLGYGVKQFDGRLRDPDDNHDFIGEARLDYHFTPKTSVALITTRQVNETDILAGPSNVLTHRVGVAYSQRITSKVRAIADLNYIRDSYRGGDVVVNLETGKRRDNYYSAGLALGFSLRKWLNLSAGYNYVERDSNFDSSDYQSNIFLLTLTAAI
ncbi:hypothetical protein DESUT3_28530 [Desulfuromonas versatilis]|uniref:TIGR03016 family PEP-CTERM system-associated outer membrane protein n=1 Tax=Desulfuromonas versatilis TaxID=2802975 RepID=A0ABN6E1W7_9BACT|nr:outer membrane beta-barrel protein [Desulfuromonas versatilis]BCR05784.1 hypothetical protein DESUT3_28530 [Desulfuromonas versatilis]